jgi:predicted amidohydrolase YtcJ
MIVTAQQVDKSENISTEQAVIAHTKGSAYAEFADSYKGTLTPGKVADLAVLCSPLSMERSFTSNEKTKKIRASQSHTQDLLLVLQNGHFHKEPLE